MSRCDVTMANLHSAPLVEVEFRDSTKALADPAVVTFEWHDPDGNVTVWTYLIDAEIVKDGVGLYHVNLPMTERGRFPWEWVGTGNDVDASDSGVLCARESVFV